jgi:hypothetical protein
VQDTVATTTILTMAKALTMYGEKIIGGHDWYQELSDKITSEMIAVGDDKAYWNPLQEDFGPELPTAYAILSLQTRVTDQQFNGCHI